MEVAHRICRNVTAGAAAACVLAFSSLIHPAHGDDAYSEDSVKAAYLYRFAGYVEWPNQSPDAPFVIDILGSPAIARELERLLPHHSIKNHPVQVREIRSLRELGNAQIVYVGTGHAQSLRALAPTPGLPAMLLVSDEEGGLSNGSALNFLTINRNVRFEVSLTAADRWGMKISSELLGVAIRVLGSGRQSNLPCLRAGPPDGLAARCGLHLAEETREPGVPNPGPRK
jgi:YfiR/HmsC-like